MQQLLPAPVAEDLIARFDVTIKELRRLATVDAVQFGIVTDQRADGTYLWQDGMAVPNHESDFPPFCGAHYDVLVPGPTAATNHADVSREEALVIGFQDENRTSQAKEGHTFERIRVVLLKLQLSIAPNPLRPEATA